MIRMIYTEKLKRVCVNPRYIGVLNNLLRIFTPNLRRIYAHVFYYLLIRIQTRDLRKISWGAIAPHELPQNGEQKVEQALAHWGAIAIKIA